MMLSSAKSRLYDAVSERESRDDIQKRKARRQPGKHN